jgi:hypothetical protein
MAGFMEWIAVAGWVRCPEIGWLAPASCQGMAFSHPVNAPKWDRGAESLRHARA